LHRHQTRKGGDIPYVSHLMAVASIALEFGAEEDEAIAALLHDAIEDAPAQLGEQRATVVRRLIEMKFGRCVLEIVEACTDTDVHPKPRWTIRRVNYITSISHKSASAILVAAADKVHNARAVLRDYRILGAKLWPRFNDEAGEAGSLGFYRALVDAFRKRTSALADPRLMPIVEELDAIVKALEDAVGRVGAWPPN